jgi:hypothetical protein
MTQLSSETRSPIAAPEPGPSRWSLFPWSLRGAAFILGMLLAALVVTSAFNPAVSPAELQRRDRLSPEAQFIDATYRHFLGRPADGAGLAEYQSVYERDGPRAVALSIVASREYELKHDQTDPGVDPTALAAQFVDLYESGAFQPSVPSDALGRLGFVLLIGACASALVVLQRVSARVLSGSALHIYVPHSMIVGLFSTLAIMWFLNAQALFYTFAPGSIGYAEWLDRVATLSITRGLDQIWTPYPQGTLVLLAALESLANIAAGWLHSEVWTSYTLFRWLFQMVFLLVPSIALVSTTYRIGMLVSPAAAAIGAGIVAFSFAPVYYGVASTVVTDPLPVCLTLLTVWFVLDRHPVWAGLTLGIAAALKLIPLVALLPAIVLVSGWSPRSRVKLAVVPVVVLACIFVPFALADADMFWSPFRWQSGRPPWESLYAFVNWLVGVPHEYLQPAFEDLGVGHSFGWVFWGITPPLTALTSPLLPTPLRWENVVAAIGILVSLVAIASARSGGPRAIVRWTLYALAVTFFWSPGWSPQYELYLIPLIALAFESPLAALGAVVALEVATFMEYPLLLPWAYFYGGSAVWLAWAATLARYLVLAWLAVYVLRGEASLSAIRERCYQLRLAHAFESMASHRERRSLLGRSLFSGALISFRSSLSGQIGDLARDQCHSLRAVFSKLTLRYSTPAQLLPIVGATFATCLLLAPTPTHAQTDASTCGPTRAAAPQAAIPLGTLDWQIPSGWFFTETGLTPAHGYSMVDDGAARMWSEFSRLGGWQVLGFPASQRFMWHGMLSQATQRAVLQWSPITGQVEFANVLDLMHDEGRDADLLASKQIPPPLDVNEAGLPYETIAANRLAWLDSRPAIRDSYCNAPGGGDPIQLWGLPTSQAVNMGQPGGEVYVLRTERAAFQEWVDGAPFAAPGEVTVALAGDLAKEFSLLPPEALAPQPAPTAQEPTN